MLQSKLHAPDTLLKAQSEYIQGQCLENLLHARVRDDGWFIAAPGYTPYGNYVWLRDNAECVNALDEYAAAFGERRLFGITAQALLRSFRYLESKEKGVTKLRTMQKKLANQEFYNDAYHPHARLSGRGDELADRWNNIQYDSVARTLVALTKHLSYNPDKSLLEKCSPGLRVAITYLFDAIWDQIDNQLVLTVCANEWEEKDEQHLKNPLFSSVVGLLYAASRYCRELEQYIRLEDINLGEFETQTESMLKGFFVRHDEVRMLKRFEERPLGTCSTALWLLTTYDVFPVGSEIFRKTLDSLRLDDNLAVSIYPDHDEKKEARVLRRYEVPSGDDAFNGRPFVDSYWGGQAWIITTAQLATALAKVGDVERASDTLSLCVESRNSEGELPEEFEGTFNQKSDHEKWKEWTGTLGPPPWLTWSHAEVLRAFVALDAACQ